MMGKSPLWRFSFFTVKHFIFSAMKPLNLNNSKRSGVAPPGGAEMRCA